MSPNVTNKTQGSGDSCPKTSQSPKVGAAMAYITPMGDGYSCAAHARLPDPHRSTTAKCALHLLLALTLLIALGQLTACGGGGDDAPDVPTPRVDCKAHPELCR